MLLSVFDSNTARGSANLNGEALRSNFMTGRTSAGFTSFLGKSAINLAEPSLYTNGVIPAPLAARNGDSGDFTMSPTAVRQHAMIIHYVGECHTRTRTRTRTHTRTHTHTHSSLRTECKAVIPPHPTLSPIPPFLHHPQLDVLTCLTLLTPS